MSTHTVSPPPCLAPVTDWGESLDVSSFHGRTDELNTLTEWIIHDRCRLVALLDMGGIGKSSLASKIAHHLQDQFEFVIWRSFRNAPSLPTLHLTEQRDRYPHQLSGGQQQRTALGRALAASPEILLLDEPLSALDALVRQQLRAEIRRIQQMFQITTLFVTHDQSEAMAIADRVAVMKDGRIEQLGSPIELYNAPKTQFSASFVGSHNALELSVQQGQIRLGNFLSVDAAETIQRQAIVFFRPEDVALTHQNQGHPAIVETKTFQGALTRLQLKIEAEGRIERIYADLPTPGDRDSSPDNALDLD